MMIRSPDVRSGAGVDACPYMDMAGQEKALAFSEGLLPSKFSLIR